MRKMYLECLSGISGDMFVAAMLDLGADEDKLQNVLKTIPLEGFEAKISRVKKAGIDACDFDVQLENHLDNHDHDMQFLFGDIHEHTSGHTHESPYEHSPEHHPEHQQEHQHEHQHRGMKEVLSILSETKMADSARALANKIFLILAQAEAKAHGTTVDEVHFHEVGAVDSIVDIISAAVCFDDLGITEVILPVLNEGSGQIRCQHGILPIPVPAVSNIILEHQLPIHISDTKAELVTPTGAAIAAAINTLSKMPESFTIQKIGIGAGKRNYESPSLLRAMVIQCTEAKAEEKIVKLESNIDDCTGETLGYTMDRLFKAGARDVNFIPVYMKKNRPAYQLNVICTEDKAPELEKIIFFETTTIGIRRISVERTILARNGKEFESTMGTANVKICEISGQNKIYPEYESVVELCNNTGKAFREVYSLIEKEAYEKYGTSAGKEE